MIKKIISLALVLFAFSHNGLSMNEKNRHERNPFEYEPGSINRLLYEQQQEREKAEVKKKRQEELENLKKDTQSKIEKAEALKKKRETEEDEISAD